MTDTNLPINNKEKQNPTHEAIKALARLSARVVNVEIFIKQMVLAARDGGDAFEAFLAEKSELGESIIKNADDAMEAVKRAKEELESANE